jgi:nucleoside-diphosphate-sugar epimerase
MRVLVTGATGFVGGHLVEALASRGAEITALVRSPGKAAALERLGVRQVRGDLGSPEALREAVRGQDVTIHVAGLIAARDEAEFLHGNRQGTLNLIEAMERAGSSRIVYVSSMAAAGPAPRGRPLAGHEPPAPVTAYGRSKLEGELAVRSSKLAWTVIRPPMIYGPRDREVLRVFRLTQLGIVPVFGDGSQELSAIYGPDLAEALVLAAAAETTIGRTYFACHPEVFTSRSFVESVGRVVRPGRALRIVTVPHWAGRSTLAVTGTLARLLGQPTILTMDKAREFYQPAWTGDPSPLMADTGWVPRHALQTGLPTTAGWYRERGWL